MLIFEKIKEYVLSMLAANLPVSLTYHDVNHTADVANQCRIIAKEEGITDEPTLLNLQIAGLYHDTGFLSQYKGKSLDSELQIKKDLTPAASDLVSESEQVSETVRKSLMIISSVFMKNKKNVK